MSLEIREIQKCHPKFAKDKTVTPNSRKDKTVTRNSRDTKMSLKNSRQTKMSLNREKQNCLLRIRKDLDHSLVVETKNGIWIMARRSQTPSSFFKSWNKPTAWRPTMMMWLLFLLLFFYLTYFFCCSILQDVEGLADCLVGGGSGVFTVRWWWCFLFLGLASSFLLCFVALLVNAVDLQHKKTKQTIGA